MSEISNLTNRQDQLCEESRRRIRDQLNAVRIGLFAYRDEMHDGVHDEAALTFQTLTASLDRLANDRALCD